MGKFRLWRKSVLNPPARLLYSVHPILTLIVLLPLRIWIKIVFWLEFSRAWFNLDTILILTKVPLNYHPSYLSQTAAALGERGMAPTRPPVLLRVRIDKYPGETGNY